MKAVNVLLLLSMTVLLIACGTSNEQQPQPGATFSGDLIQDNPGENTSASGGHIEFTISEDGESISSLSYSLIDDNCWNESKSMTRQGVGYTVSKDPPPLITDGGFVWKDNSIDVEATFISSTEASGSMAIEIDDMFSELLCDYGEWTWSASVQ